MGYARLALDPDLLIAALHLPATTRIIGADMDHSHGQVVLTVQHADLTHVEVKAGESLPLTTPIFKTEQPCACISLVSWGQGG